MVPCEEFRGVVCVAGSEAIPRRPESQVWTSNKEVFLEAHVGVETELCGTL